MTEAAGGRPGAPALAPEATERLRRWIDELVATPGLTAVRDPTEAWRVHVEDSLSAVELATGYPGSIVDVGSGGGAPGLVLAAALPERDVTLLEASSRKCAFLERAAQGFANVRVVHGRAEEQEVDVFGVAVAKALAPPPVAAEWCLPLVRPGGVALLYAAGELDNLDHVAARLAARAARVEPVPGSRERRLVLLEKVGPTPPGFPRRPGMARKRPLG